jgi:hypothetical protein
MEFDARLNAQLKNLGKKLFQFRDLVAKLEIPDELADAEQGRLFWSSFVKKCSAAVTVLRQIQSSLTPDMYHLSVFPSDKIWRDPAAVPDLLSMPDLIPPTPLSSGIATTMDEVHEWNTKLDLASRDLEEFIASQPATKRALKPSGNSRPLSTSTLDPLLARLYSTTSEQRVNEDSNR